jgi:hypothetical protein
MLREFTLIIALGACADIDVATSEQPVAIPIGGVATNGVATNGVATNGVATNALASDAIAYGALADLDGAVTNPYVKLGLEDPNAQSFMKYLVSCALAPDQSISWTDHAGNTTTWRGALSMCPTWDHAPPDLGCRRRVSACILARNNAFGVSVMLSMRGNNVEGPITLAPSVSPHVYVPLSKMTPVASLEGCPVQTVGPQRDCGWRAANVGRCTPGTLVSVAEGNRAQCIGDILGKAMGDTMLRVCDGISACDAATAIASVGKACGSSAPVIDFTCPKSGNYAVMHASEDSTVKFSRLNVVEATPSSPVAYPAPENDVFRWREGAFYGDIFGAGNLAPGKPQITVDPSTFAVIGGTASTEWVGVAFPNMFACSSGNWKQHAAYVAQRVCAGPGPHTDEYTRDCAATYVGPCQAYCKNDSQPLGDQDYYDCRDSNDEVYREPLTTMLAAPCDAIQGDACKPVPNAPVTF